jgi:methylase of polypeptide subunit release factors
MIYLLQYILIIFLFFLFLFFLSRSIVVAVTMLTEVPFLPSSNLFKKAIDYLDIEDGNSVLDIGSGDGRILMYTSKKYPNSTFLGIEKNLFLVIYSNILKTIMLRKNLKFVRGDIHEFSIKDFDRIYLYLTPKFIDDILIKKEEEVKRGCKIVSLDFPMG